MGGSRTLTDDEVCPFTAGILTKSNSKVDKSLTGVRLLRFLSGDRDTGELAEDDCVADVLGEEGLAERARRSLGFSLTSLKNLVIGVMRS